MRSGEEEGPRMGLAGHLPSAAPLRPLSGLFL